MVGFDVWWAACAGAVVWGWYNIVSTRWVCCSGLEDSGFGVQFARVFVLGLFVAFIGAGCWWLAYFAVVGVSSGVGGFGRFWSI